MGIAKVEEALSAFELQQWPTTTTRREEDQISLVQHSSRSRTLNGPDPDVSSPPENCCSLRAKIILWAITLILALVIGLSVGLTKKHSTSVSSWRIPYPYEFSLTTITEKFTQAHWVHTRMPILFVLVLVATPRSSLMYRSVTLSSMLHLVGVHYGLQAIGIVRILLYMIVVSAQV